MLTSVCNLASTRQCYYRPLAVWRQDKTWTVCMHIVKGREILQTPEQQSLCMQALCIKKTVQARASFHNHRSGYQVLYQRESTVNERTPFQYFASTNWKKCGYESNWHCDCISRPMVTPPLNTRSQQYKYLVRRNGYFRIFLQILPKLWNCQ